LQFAIIIALVGVGHGKRWNLFKS